MGVVLGVYFFQIPSLYTKLLFTFVATAIGVALAFSRWGILVQHRRRHRHAGFYGPDFGLWH